MIEVYNSLTKEIPTAEKGFQWNLFMFPVE